MRQQINIKPMRQAHGARAVAPHHSRQGGQDVTRCEARSPSPLAARDCGRRAWSRRDPASPLLRRALSPDRLHPRSAEAKCSISPLCCGAAPRRGGAWRAPAPPTPPPQEKPDEPPLPRIAEEKDSPTHHSKIALRTPAKQTTPSIFTSSPKTSLDKAFDASNSFASLSLSDESFAPDTSVDLDTSRDTTIDNTRLDESRSSTDNSSISADDKMKKPAEPQPTEPQTTTRKRSDPSLQDDDKKRDYKKDKPELKKQESLKKEKVEEPKAEDRREKVMERTGSVKKVESRQEKAEAKKQEKLERQEKAEIRKQERIEKKTEAKKEGLKRQESVDAMKAGEAEGEARKSMVSKLLGVMGRKGRDLHDDDRPKKADKAARKKGGNTPTQPAPKPIEAAVEKEIEDPKKKGRGRASSSSSGEK